MAAENVIQSQNYLKQGKWAYAPTLAGVAQSSYQKVGDNSATESVQVGGVLSWEPDIWGKITANKRAYNNALMRDFAAVRSIQSAVVAQIASLYYQLIALDEQLIVTKEFITLSQNTVRTLTIMRDNGSSNSAAVEQARAQLFSAMASVSEIESAIYSAESSMGVLLGRVEGEIKRSAEFTHMNNPFQGGIPFYLISNRPDVKIAEYTVMQAFNLTQSAKASMYPAFKFSFDAGAVGSSMFEPTAFAMNFLGGITAPIFNGRALRTQYEVSSSKHRQYVTQFENSLRVAGAELANAIFTFGNLQKQVDLRHQEVEANQKSVDYTVELLNNGAATYLEVLSAQSNFLNSSLQLINDQLNCQTTFITLYKSLGGGWQ